MERSTIEIVDFPMKNCDFPVRYVNVYQRVVWYNLFPPFFYGEITSTLLWLIFIVGWYKLFFFYNKPHYTIEKTHPHNHVKNRCNVVKTIINYSPVKLPCFWVGFKPFPNGSVSKPCTPVVHIKIAGIYGCSSH